MRAGVLVELVVVFEECMLVCCSLVELESLFHYSIRSAKIDMSYSDRLS